MQAIHKTLQNLTLGQPQVFLNLSLFPLHRDKAPPAPYVTLRSALAAGEVRITEVSAGGHVPELRLENRGARPVLILDGEELVGAKQNRIANVTILAPAKSTINIPVSCVEAGRWAYQSPEFRDADRAQFAAGRRLKAARVSESLRSSGRRDANQGEVWQQISAKMACMEVASPTSAMADVFEQHRTRVDDYVGAFTTTPDQVGAVFAIGERVEGLECFDAAATFRELLPKLVRSYAIDAMESVAQHRRNASADAARKFLAGLGQAEVESYPGVGLGTDVRLTAPGLVAGGLVHDNALVHLVAFATPAGEGGGAQREDRPMARATARRRTMWW